GRRRAELLDTLLAPLFDVRAEERGEGAPIALAGVGGYGRGAVALRSDVDVRLLGKNVRSAAELADALLYPLWDMGLAVGHQVVTIDELLDAARDDLPSATCLLDWRHVAGEAALSTRLRDKSEAGLFAHSELPRFMERLTEEVEQRHDRF